MHRLKPTLASGSAWWAPSSHHMLGRRSQEEGYWPEALSMCWEVTVGYRCWWMAVTGQAQLLVTGCGALLGVT